MPEQIIYPDTNSPRPDEAKIQICTTPPEEDGSTQMPPGDCSVDSPAQLRNWLKVKDADGVSRSSSRSGKGRRSRTTSLNSSRNTPKLSTKSTNGFLSVDDPRTNGYLNKSLIDAAQDTVSSRSSIASSVSLVSLLGLTGVDVSQLGRSHGKRIKKDRLVAKNGECKIVYGKVSKKGVQFLVDFFTTMLELKWRYHFLLFALAFALSWMIFGLIWWAVYAIDHRLHFQNQNTTDEIEPCVIGVNDFATAFLFSIETQHTIGYGTRAMTSACPPATILLMIQSMIGAILQCVLTGIIFAKMARPKSRAHTIIFSDTAVINNRDGDRCLMFRVGDMRQSQILDAKVHVMLARRRVTQEGEYLPIVTQDLPVTTESGSEFIFLAWPVVMMHQIDEASPIWDLSEDDLLEKDWELIVVFEGVDEVTGSSFQVRTSYLPSEIKWGYKLRSLFSNAEHGLYHIDYSDFHEIEPVNFVSWSARNQQRGLRQRNKDGNSPDDQKQKPEDTE